MEAPAPGRAQELHEVGLRGLSRPAPNAMAQASTRRRRHRRRVFWPYLYVLPALCAMGFAFAFPLVQVVRDSFYAGNFAAPIWVGLDNYKGVIDDPEFRQSLLNNLRLLVTVPVMLGLGLA